MDKGCPCQAAPCWSQRHRCLPTHLPPAQELMQTKHSCRLSLSLHSSLAQQPQHSLKAPALCCLRPACILLPFHPESCLHPTCLPVSCLHPTFLPASYIPACILPVSCIPACVPPASCLHPRSCLHPACIPHPHLHPACTPARVLHPQLHPACILHPCLHLTPLPASPPTFLPASRILTCIPICIPAYIPTCLVATNPPYSSARFPSGFNNTR